MIPNKHVPIQNDIVLKMPADFYERYGLDPYSGTPADTFNKREKGESRPGRPLKSGSRRKQNIGGV